MNQSEKKVLIISFWNKHNEFIHLEQLMGCLDENGDFIGYPRSCRANHFKPFMLRIPKDSFYIAQGGCLGHLYKNIDNIEDTEAAMDYLESLAIKL